MPTMNVADSIELAHDLNKDELVSLVRTLTAGGDPTPVLEDTLRSPGQFIHWFIRLNETERHLVARQVLANADDAHQCFVENHRGQLEQMEHLMNVGRWLIAEARWVALGQEKPTTEQRDAIARWPTRAHDED